jgi:plastocyanin
LGCFTCTKPSPMKKAILFTLIVMMTTIGIHAQTNDTIKDNGFTFSPAELTVNVGDTVVFAGSDFHPVLEVNEATWTNKGTTPLAGGFDFPSGSGKIKFTHAGVHYYVCTAHVASKNMKGKITVVVPSAIPDISGNAAVYVYPIPLTGSTLYVTFKNQAQKNFIVSVYDLAGNLRISSNGSTSNGQYSVDCTNLPKGLFLMKLSSEDGDTYTKFIKQ